MNFIREKQEKAFTDLFQNYKNFPLNDEQKGVNS